MWGHKKLVGCGLLLIISIQADSGDLGDGICFVWGGFQKKKKKWNGWDAALSSLTQLESVLLILLFFKTCFCKLLGTTLLGIIAKFCF